MGIYNELLSARFPKLVQRLFSMKGEQAVKQLSGELMLVQDLPYGPEHRYLMDEIRYALAVNVNAGGAGVFSAARLRNPVGSGIIATVEKLAIASGAATGSLAQVDLSNVTVDFTTIPFTERLDARATNVHSAMIASNQNNLGAATNGTIGSFVLVANTTYDAILNENQEITVLPGDALTVGENTANQNILVTMFWRERPLEESEKK